MIIGLHEERFWHEGKFMSTFFRKDMKVYIYSGADTPYAEECIKDFNAPSQELLDDISEALYLHCADSLNLWAEIDKRDEIEKTMAVEFAPCMDKSKLLKCLRPSVLSVRESLDGQIGWQAELECQWEPEKGLEIVVLGGKLLYLGTFADNSPWDEFPQDDSSNYAART
ncbi:MAG TPA: hypothetical protein P5191_01335 [Ruminococcus sp.]|nr:hypothetical protein [Ruminococcus sp.]